MNKTEKILLGLAAAAALVLSVGVVYSAAVPQQYRQTGGNSGMMGGGLPGGMMGGYHAGGMMGGTYSGGMMGASAYASGMTGGFGTMMGHMAHYMSGFWNQTWTASHGGAGAYVALVGYAFYPASVTISRGATVTWVNMDFVQHTVTSGTEGAQTGYFDSHELNHMQSFSYAFNTPGTYAYYCDIHPGMVGTISVVG